MSAPTTILLTAPSPGLVAELARQRPRWAVVPLADLPPTGRIDGAVWGFVDWLCPTMSGMEMCQLLREAEATRSAHLTMVLDEPEREAQRRALRAGADDYLVGPLSAAAVIERVGHGAGEAEDDRPVLAHGTIAIDLLAHQVRVGGQVVPLPPKAMRLLTHFMEHPDRVLTRMALIESLGNAVDDTDERTVDVWVGRLRRALAENGASGHLRTVRSLGYIFDSR